MRCCEVVKVWVALAGQHTGTIARRLPSCKHRLISAVLRGIHPKYPNHRPPRSCPALRCQTGPPQTLESKFQWMKRKGLLFVWVKTPCLLVRADAHCRPRKRAPKTATSRKHGKNWILLCPVIGDCNRLIVAEAYAYACGAQTTRRRMRAPLARGRAAAQAGPGRAAAPEGQHCRAQ